MSAYSSFIFEGYSFDARSRVASLHYSYDGKLHFTEQYEFQFEPMAGFSTEALDRALRALWLMAGVSYYKAYLPDTIQVKGSGLTGAEAAYYSRNYLAGLGEFLYRNGLSVVRQIHFPSVDGRLGKPLSVPGLQGSLVPLGGGKDSLLSTDIMSSAGEPFATWTVNHSERFATMIERIGAPNLAVERRLDPRLIELQEQGAYAGHVPITGILAMAAVASAILSGKQYVVFSNEASANEPTMVVDGFAVNHQYSKTLEFERDLQSYIRANITPDIEVFSLLRPLSELQISKLFAERVMSRFGGMFSSCNRNFTMHSTGSLSWCGECPKCAFVFLMFAPFVQRDSLIQEFDGHNPLADLSLRPLYDDILGLTREKPFDCVGETAEARQALRMAQATGEWPELARYQLAAEGYDYREWHESAMPEHFLKQLRAYLQG